MILTCGSFLESAANFLANKWTFNFPLLGVYSVKLVLCYIYSLGAIGGKTGKTEVLPGFWKIERSGSSGGAPLCYRGLIWPGQGSCAGGAPVQYSGLFLAQFLGARKIVLREICASWLVHSWDTVSYFHEL